MSQEKPEPVASASPTLVASRLKLEEEEGEMFPKCRKSDMDLKALGESLEVMKNALMSEMTEGSAPG